MGSKENAYFVVEQASEQSVENDEEKDGHRQSEGKVIQSAGNEKITFSFLLEVGGVGVHVVLGCLLDGILNSLPLLFQPRHLPLLLLNVLDRFEDGQGCPIVVVLVVIIEPQVVKGEAEGFDASPLEVVENRFESGQHIEDLTFFHTLAILIHLVKLGTLHAVVFGLVAGFTLL